MIACFSSTARELVGGPSASARRFEAYVSRFSHFGVRQPSDSTDGKGSAGDRSGRLSSGTQKSKIFWLCSMLGHNITQFLSELVLRLSHAPPFPTFYFFCLFWVVLTTLRHHLFFDGPGSFLFASQIISRFAFVRVSDHEPFCLFGTGF